MTRTRPALAAWGVLTLFSPASAAGDLARVQGVIAAAPKSGAPSGSAGDAAYANRALRDAQFFNYGDPGRFVVYLIPTRSAEPDPVFRTIEAKVRPSRGRMRMEPDFLLAPVGAEIHFENIGPEDYNLFAGGLSTEPFNLQLPAGGAKKILCARVGPMFIRSLDDEHFSATLFVSSPYAAATDGKGRYGIDVPPGKYRVEVWHYRLPPLSREVRAAAGETVRADFVLSVNTLEEVR